MYVRTYVRTNVRASRWKIFFTPYLVVELSPSAEIWCVHVTSIIEGAQILTSLGIHNNRDFLALQRTGGALERTGGAIERSKHVLPLEPAAAYTAGPLMILRTRRQ